MSKTSDFRPNVRSRCRRARAASWHGDRRPAHRATDPTTKLIAAGGVAASFTEPAEVGGASSSAVERVDLLADLPRLAHYGFRAHS
jgi:hypothetical protein